MKGLQRLREPPMHPWTMSWFAGFSSFRNGNTSPPRNGENMSASVGPRGGPRPPTAPPSMPELPDLSHLTEEERKIIMAVMVRQREEEAKEQQAILK